MCSGCNCATDFIEVRLHSFGVGIRHDDGNTGIAARADSTEQIGVLISLILRLARSGSFLGPLINEAVLLSDPHFVLEPHLGRGGCASLLTACATTAGKFF